MAGLHALLIGSFASTFTETFSFAWAKQGGTFVCREALPLTFETLDTSQCDAIAAYITTYEQVEWLLRAEVPVVNLSGTLADDRIPRLTVDQASAGALAAQHLLLRGHQHFAFIGYDDLPFSLEREQGFIRRIETAGHACHRLPLAAPWRKGHRGLGLHQRATASIGRFLADLPRPLALFTANDSIGLIAMQAAEQVGYVVPDDLIVIGMDDTPDAAVADVPLTSVAHPFGVLGRHCALMLHEAVGGEALVSQGVAALDIRSRQSTDAFTGGDAVLLRQVQEWLATSDPSASVDDLAVEVGMSPRQVHRRLRAASDTTAVHLLRRNRLRHARLLMDSSAAELPTIAKRAGFGTRQGLAKALREEYDLTPADFRRVARGRQPREFD